MKWLALFAALIIASAAYGLSLSLARDPAAHLKSDDIFGIGTPVAGCPTGYDCDPIGTVTECTVEDAAGVVTFTTVNPGDTSGVCPAHKAYVAETDWHCEFAVTSVTGGGQYAGTGCELSQSDGDYSTPDPKAYCWYADGRVRMKYDVGRAGQTSSVSSEVLVPGTFRVANEYDDTTNGYVCGYKVGADFFQVGTTQTALAFTSGVRGPFASGYHASNAATIVTGDWEDTTTRDPYTDAGEPDPDPPGESDTPDYPFAENSTIVGTQTQVPLANEAALTAVASSLVCGRDYVLGSGSYTSNKTLVTASACAATAPVRIIGATNFASTATGLWTLRGTRLYLIGVNFSGTNARVVCQGSSTKVLGNKFSGWGHVASAVRPDSESSFGEKCEIAYNEISNPAPMIAGGTALTNNARRGVQMNSTSNLTATGHYGAWVHHNYFHDFPNKPGDFYSGDSDASEIGESIYASTYTWASGWYFEDNLIERHLQVGEAAVDVKLSHVVLRRNTVVDSTNMGLNLRVGNNHVLESNWVDTGDGGGSTVHGADNTICGNVYRTGQIKLVAGTVAWDSNTAGNVHAQTYQNHVVNNAADIVVGHSPTSAYSIDSDGTLLEAQVDELEEYGAEWIGITFTIQKVTDRHVNTVDNQNGAATYDCPLATKLEPGQVGPTALLSAPADYREARGF
jgi:hypothetical protein